MNSVSPHLQEHASKETNQTSTQADTPHYAGWLLRTAAQLVDLAICGFFVGFAIYIVDTLMTDSLFCLLIFLFPICYKFLLESSPRKATCGKLLFGLWVDTLNNRPLSRIKSFFRAVLSLLITLVMAGIVGNIGAVIANSRAEKGEIWIWLVPFVLFVSNYVFMFFYPQKQTLYDELLGTVVKKKWKKSPMRTALALAVVSIVFGIFFLAIYFSPGFDV